LLFAGYPKMAIIGRRGVMGAGGSTNNVTAFNNDMRDVLRARKARLPDVTRDVLAMTILASDQIQKIDHVIEGLQGL
jgi:hypothetical protein